MRRIAAIARILGWRTILGIMAPFSAAAVETVATDFTLKEWHTSHGLPSDQIVRLVQDEQGYLWVGATDGLRRFDGSHFTAEATDENGFATRTFVSARGVGVVAAHPRAGLVKFDRGELHPLPEGPFHERRVFNLFAEPGGALWAVTDGGTILRSEHEHVQTLGPAESLPRGRSRSFAVNRAGQVWVASTGFLARHVGGRLERVPGEWENIELAVVSSASGGVWIIAGQRVLRSVGDELRDVAELPALLGAHYFRAGLEDRYGDLWLGTRSQGLYVINQAGRHRVPTSHEDISALCEDREGNIWVGTNGGGLNRVSRKTYRLYDKSAGLLDNFSYTVCSDEEGAVWLANRDGGVVRIRDGQLVRFADQSGWPSLSALSIFPRVGGGVVFSCGMGMFTLDANQQTPMPQRISSVRPELAPRVTYAARNGDIWFSADPNRIARLRGDAMTLFAKEGGVNGREVRAITEDDTGTIWAGTFDGQLLRFTGERFERHPLPGIDLGAIQSIRFEAGTGMWLATMRAGIVLVNGSRISSCAKAQGLPEDDVTQMLPDDHGYLWVASKHSIFRLGRADLLDVLGGRQNHIAVRVVAPDEGLPDIFCSGQYQPGAWKGADGTLWFATRHGVVALDPTRQLTSPPAPAVTVEEVAVNEVRVPGDQLQHLPASFQKLEFGFDVLSLSHAERLEVDYQLVGFDEDWVAAPASHRVAFPRLPPGAYRFRVRAGFRDDASSTSMQAIDFAIIPRWWQTAWFRGTLLLLGAAGMILAARGWSHRRLRQRLEKLERESAIRTRIAQNIHDDLGANLTQISLLTQAARQNPASGVDCLEQIHRTVGEITRSMDEVVWSVNPRFDNVDNFVGYLGEFARSYLGAANIRCRLNLPDTLADLAVPGEARHHLFLCCKEALHNIAKHSGATEVTVAVQVQGTQLVLDIADNGRGLIARPAGASAHEMMGDGSGLENMRLRMAELGGTFSVSSSENGTRLQYSLECRVASRP